VFVTARSTERVHIIKLSTSISNQRQLKVTSDSDHISVSDACTLLFAFLVFNRTSRQRNTVISMTDCQLPAVRRVPACGHLQVIPIRQSTAAYQVQRASVLTRRSYSLEFVTS